MKDYEFKISQFIDNELSVNEQQELFRFLSESQEGRQTLTEFMEVKKEMKSFYAGMNVELNDSEIVAASVSAQNEKEKKYRMMVYFSAAAAIFFAFMLLVNQFKENPILTKYQNLQTEMIKLQENHSDVLSKQIELVRMNTQLYEETEKLKTAQMVINKKSDKKVQRADSPMINKQKNKKESSHTSDNSSSMVAALQNIQRIEITKNDFLGGQIIGN